MYSATDKYIYQFWKMSLLSVLPPLICRFWFRPHPKNPDCSPAATSSTALLSCLLMPSSVRDLCSNPEMLQLPASLSTLCSLQITSEDWNIDQIPFLICQSFEPVYLPGDADFQSGIWYSVPRVRRVRMHECQWQAPGHYTLVLPARADFQPSVLGRNGPILEYIKCINFGKVKA